MKDENVVDVSDSRTNAWNYCPHGWGLQYIDGWEKVVKHASLNKGSLFHEGVEYAMKELIKIEGYSLKDVNDLRNIFVGLQPNINALIDLKAQKVVDEGASVLSAEDIEGIEEQAQTAAWMTGHYLHFLAQVLEHKVIVGIEIKFEDDVQDKIGTAFKTARNRGIIDLILYDVFEDTVFVIDHKSAADLLNAEERLSHSVQLVGYCRWMRGMIDRGEVMDVLGSDTVTLDLAGAKIRPMLRVVRNKLPKEPKLLKNGSVSAAAVSTLKSVYEAALNSVGEVITEKQQARLDSLPVAWHTTIEPVIGDAETEQWEGEMLVVGQRMEQARKLPVYRTRNTRNCYECSLRNVCKLGDDPEWKQNKEE